MKKAIDYIVQRIKNYGKRSCPNWEVSISIKASRHLTVIWLFNIDLNQLLCFLFINFMWHFTGNVVAATFTKEILEIRKKHHIPCTKLLVLLTFFLASYILGGPCPVFQLWHMVTLAQTCSPCTHSAKGSDNSILNILRRYCTLKLPWGFLMLPCVTSPC